MHFFVSTVISKERIVNNAHGPYIILVIDNWDDFGYKTTFDAYYVNSENQETFIEKVKIYRKGSKVSAESIPRDFGRLNKEWCSLGQDIDYYKKLIELVGIEKTKKILHNLNDVVLSEEIRDKFEEDKGFNNSLLRWSETEKYLYEARKIFGISGKVFQASFAFECKLNSAVEPHKFSFDFNNDEYLPYRINVIIGKNGTGKTQILAKLANALSGYKLEQQGFFEESRPLFSQVIAVSYSAFDIFEKPHQDNLSLRERINNRRTSFSHGITKPDGKDKKSEYSYVYCGLQNAQGTYSLPEIMKNLTISLNKVKLLGRVEKWRNILSQIIEENYDYILDELEKGGCPDEISSGQSILLASMTEVISNIKPQSILIIDEPELHLHPNAISNLIRMLHILLKEFDSYAIISTHSPIIIQETPAKYVHVVERYGNEPYVRKLNIESFGENLSNITTEVFAVKSSESNYKAYLKEMYKKKSYNEIVNYFAKGLSLNALLYLKVLFSSRNGGKR